MRSMQIRWSACLTMSVAMGCGGPTTGPDVAASGASLDAISISVRSDTELKGIFAYGGDVVEFEGTLSPQRVYTAFKVNGALFEHWEDFTEKRREWNGHGNSTFEQ